MSLTDLEDRALEDLDLIAGLSEAGLLATTVNDTDRAEDVLSEINDIASSWEDPDA